MSMKKNLAILALESMALFTTQVLYIDNTFADDVITVDTTVYENLKNEIVEVAQKCGIIDLSRINLKTINNEKYVSIRNAIDKIIKNTDKDYKIIIKEDNWEKEQNNTQFEELKKRIEELKERIKESNCKLKVINIESNANAEKIIKAIKLAEENKVLCLSEVDLAKISENELLLIEAGILHLTRNCSAENQLCVVIWSSDLSNNNLMKVTEVIYSDNKSKISVSEEKIDYQNIRRIFVSAYDTGIIDLRKISIKDLDDCTILLLQYNIMYFLKNYHSRNKQLKLLVNPNDQTSAAKLLNKYVPKEKNRLEIVLKDKCYEKYLEKVFKQAKKNNILDLTSVNLSTLSDNIKEKYKKKIESIKDNVKVIEIKSGKKNKNGIPNIVFDVYEEFVKKANEIMKSRNRIDNENSEIDRKILETKVAIMKGK